MLGLVQVISIPMTASDLLQEKQENAQAGRFSLHLDFLFELNEVCM